MLNKTRTMVSSQLDLDDNGFIRDADDWTEDMAQLLGESEAPGGLGKNHWKLIYYLRCYYMENGSVPPVLMVRRQTGLNLETIYKLFPAGLGKGACRLAGIPASAILPGFLYP